MKQQPIEQQLITLIQSHVSNTAIQKHMIDLVSQAILNERQRIVEDYGHFKCSGCTDMTLREVLKAIDEL